MASGALNPVSDYDPPEFARNTKWDYIRLDGFLSPGTCEITGFDRGWGWDVKAGKGSQGTTPTYTNKQECEGEITFYLWTGLHFSEWEEFRPLFLYDPTKSNDLQAVGIFHPSLYDLGIKSVVTRKLSPVRHIGENLFTVVAKLLVYEPPPKASAVATPTSATTGTGVNTTAPPSPQDPLEQKIGSLFSEVQQP